MKISSRIEAKAAGEKRYFTGVPCKNGHTEERLVSSGGCMACAREMARDRHARLYSSDSDYRERILAKNATHRQKESYKEWNRSRIKTDEYRAYRVDYLGKPHMREKKRAYDKIRQQTDEYKKKKKERYRSDPAYRVVESLRGRLVRCARSIKTGEKISVKSIDAISLMQRIEFNFKPGMSWKNHGEWHIDHVKPIAAFVFQGKRLALANLLCNLRPEWKKDNMVKSSTFKGVTYRFASSRAKDDQDKG